MNTKLFGAVNNVEETYGVIVNFNGVTPLQLLAVQGDVTDVIADRTNSYCAANETTFDVCCFGFGDRCVSCELCTKLSRRLLFFF